jgi:hypothetical protein
MTRGRRTPLIYGCVGLAAMPVLLVFLTTPGVMSHDLGFLMTPDAMSLTPPRVKFGVIEWLTVEREAARAGAIGLLHWEVEPIAASYGVLASTVWVTAVFVAGRWLVRNSSIRRRCDTCGFSADLRSAACPCPECGELRAAADEARAISPSSWLLLLVLLVTMGATGTLLSLTGSLLAISNTSQFFNPSKPPWILPGSTLDLIAYINGAWLLSPSIFLVWFYLEPSKHRQRARYRRRSAGRGAPPQTLIRP